jgi:hypothetical protein
MKKYIPFRKKQTFSEQIMEQVTDAANKITEQAVATASTLKGQATGTAASLKSQATGTAASLKHQASDAASTAKTQASGTASSIATHAADRVRETSVGGDQLSKEVKALAMQAATAAVELLENARDRSHAAFDSAPTREQLGVASREQLGLASAAVSGRAKSAESALIDQAQRLLELAKQAEQPIGMSVAAAKEKSSLAAAAAKEKSAVAATEAAKAGKNGVAIALWSTALIAIVLYIIMGKERREKTIKRAKAAAGEVQDLVRDYRGYDAEMETA